jgi:hypothetical protein
VGRRARWRLRRYEGRARTHQNAAHRHESSSGAVKSGSMARMTDTADVRHDTIVVPKDMHIAQVRALAEHKAQAQVAEDERVFDLQLGPTAYPVGGDQGTGVEWPFSYQVVPPGGSAGARPR